MFYTRGSEWITSEYCVVGRVAQRVALNVALAVSVWVLLAILLNASAASCEPALAGATGET